MAGAWEAHPTQGDGLSTVSCRTGDVRCNKSVSVVLYGKYTWSWYKFVNEHRFTKMDAIVDMIEKQIVMGHCDDWLIKIKQKSLIMYLTYFVTLLECLFGDDHAKFKLDWRVGYG